jgi:hypothetical protein
LKKSILLLSEINHAKNTQLISRRMLPIFELGCQEKIPTKD